MKIRDSEKKILKLSLQLMQLVFKSKKMLLTDLVICQPDQVVPNLVSMMKENHNYAWKAAKKTLDRLIS